MDLLNSSNLEQLALKGLNHYQNEHVTCYINSSGDYSCERMRVAILVPLLVTVYARVVPWRAWEVYCLSAIQTKCMLSVSAYYITATD